jgi:hypothetical protein
MEMIIALALKIRCIRSMIIRLKYSKKSADNRIDRDEMKKVYQFYEPPEFVIEEAYIFILPNIMQAVFFCQLQPILLLFAFVQTCLFYWVCKIKVLKFCRIPVLLDKFIFDSAIYQVMLAPVFYGIGSICNTYISNRINPNIQFSFLGAAICLGLGVFNYLNPGNIFQRLVEWIPAVIDCLKADNIYDQEKLRASDGSQNSRLENYYRNSNSLNLLGFEKVILGQNKSEEIVKELQGFCESHVGLSHDKDNDDDSSAMSDFSTAFHKAEVKKSMVANIFE